MNAIDMQNIHIRLEKENGEVMEHFKANFADIFIYLLEMIPNRHEKYPWLDSIDEYGITLFNSRQMPRIISELENLRVELDKMQYLEIGKTIEEVITDLKKVKEFRYARFIGD